MNPLRVFDPGGGRLRVLALGAHADDIEIGCGGTLMRLCAERELEVLWVVFCSTPARAEEARASAAHFLRGAAASRVVIGSHRDGFLPYEGSGVKDEFEAFKQQFQPDLVLTHYREDRHQDHRLVSDLTYQTFRDHLVLEYEIMKVDGDLGNPNVYVGLDAKTVDRKVRLLDDCFGSQRDRRWFSEDAFRGLMRLRGVESGAPSGYAEAFYGRKLVL